MLEGIETRPEPDLDLGNPAITGFEPADRARRKYPAGPQVPASRDPLGEPECRIPLFAAEKPEERREGVGAPSVERAREARPRAGNRA